jgi:hypothetical protein
VADWHQILEELQREQQEHSNLAASTMDRVRRKYLRSLFDLTGRNVIAYYSGWLTKPNVEGVDINDDDMNAFMACIHGMDRSRGLDLILHTPGGGIAATESLVQYLKKMFGDDIRAIVPQIAMSAGTMLSLSCRSIVMGKQSSLGPIDPQIHGIPADVVVTEFLRAYEEIKEDMAKAQVWGPILGRYTPSFLSQCEYAVEWSKHFVRDALVSNMLKGHEHATELADEIVASLSSAAVNKAHNKHIHIDQIRDLGISVEVLEDDQGLQDAVLSVHHAFVHTMSSTTALKIVENHEGKAAVRHIQQPVPVPFLQA